MTATTTSPMTAPTALPMTGTMTAPTALPMTGPIAGANTDTNTHTNTYTNTDTNTDTHTYRQTHPPTDTTATMTNCVKGSRARGKRRWDIEIRLPTAIGRRREVCGWVRPPAPPGGARLLSALFTVHSSATCFRARGGRQSLHPRLPFHTWGLLVTHRISSTLTALLFLAGPVLADGPADNVPDKVRRVPPPGIAVPPEVKADSSPAMTTTSTPAASRAAAKKAARFFASRKALVPTARIVAAPWASASSRYRCRARTVRWIGSDWSSRAGSKPWPSRVIS